MWQEARGGAVGRRSAALPEDFDTILDWLSLF